MSYYGFIFSLEVYRNEKCLPCIIHYVKFHITPDINIAMNHIIISKITLHILNQ